MTPGQLPALVLAAVSGLLDVLTATGVLHLDAAQRTALITVASSAIALGIALYALFGHQMALKQTDKEIARINRGS
jgi:hypothetical protein